MPTAITSLTNERVKQLVRLQRESRVRRASGLFCLETERELGRAVAAGYAVRELWVAREMIAQPPSAPDPTPIVEASAAVLRKASYREHPTGFIAVMEARRPSLAAFDPPAPELLIVVSGLEKPGNLGAIARTAAAAGAGGLLVDRPDVDLYNPNAIRASTGAVFALPIIAAEPEAIRDWLIDRGVRIVAATPEAAVTQLMIDLAGPTALVLGSEAAGLEAFWREAATLATAIYMPGAAVDSLNVSVSAAVLLFEAVRQRVT